MVLKKFIGDRAFYHKVVTIMMPILVQNVITNFVGLLDNVMVGQVGTEQMSGVGIVNQLLFIFNLFIFGGMAGVGIFTAQYCGAGDDEGVRQTVRMKLYVALGAVILFTTVFLTAGGRLISSFLHEGGSGLDLEATLGYGKEYMTVMYFGMLPFALKDVYSSSLRERGETVLPMKAGIFAVLLNLVLNYILIFGKLGFPALGVTGAAAATVIARVAECAIVVIWTHRHKDEQSFIVGVYSSPRVPLALVKQIIILGTPLLLNEVMWSSGMAVLNQSYSLRGLEVVSATNIATTVSNLFFCAFLSMGSAISIIVGQLLGAGETEQAVDEDRKMIAFSVVLCTVVGVIMALLAPLIPELYNTTDAVKTIARELLLVSACMMPVNAFTNACYFTLRSGGKTVITFIFDSAFVWCVDVPVLFVLSRFTDMPILRLYISIQALEAIKCVMGYVMVKSRSWVRNLVA